MQLLIRLMLLAMPAISPGEKELIGALLQEHRVAPALLSGGYFIAGMGQSEVYCTVVTEANHFLTRIMIFLFINYGKHVTF